MPKLDTLILVSPAVVQFPTNLDSIWQFKPDLIILNREQIGL